MTDIILDEEDFDDFVNEILRNPIDDNGNLRDLLDRPNRWNSDSVEGRWNSDSVEDPNTRLEKDTPPP